MTRASAFIQGLVRLHVSNGPYDNKPQHWVSHSLVLAIILNECLLQSPHSEVKACDRVTERFVDSPPATSDGMNRVRLLRGAKCGELR